MFFFGIFPIALESRFAITDDESPVLLPLLSLLRFVTRLRRQRAACTSNFDHHAIPLEVSARTTGNDRATTRRSSYCKQLEVGWLLKTQPAPTGSTSAIIVNRPASVLPSLTLTAESALHSLHAPPTQSRTMPHTLPSHAHRTPLQERMAAGM